jgi:UDP-N-acetylmuramate--alanine ligase
MFGKIKHFHLIGIGGIGMSGIAELLHDWGYTISGSDAKHSDNIARLEKRGIKVHIGHGAENVTGCDAVIYTAAIESHNPELQAARKMGIPVIKRAKILGEILRARPNSVAIAGTHGKTTTTSLIGHLFMSAGRDPIIIAGGILKELNSTIHNGSGDTIIVEADEFDRSFHQLYPTHIVLTSIDPEHLDIYGNLESVRDSFIQFVNRLPFYGKLVLSDDDRNIRSILPQLTVNTLKYSLDHNCDIQANNIRLSQSASEFNVIFAGKKLGSVHLPLPGAHNVKNALAAIAIGLEYGIDFPTCASTLKTFGGVKRRFDIIYQSPELMLVDDYAHHYREIEATLTAAKSGWQRRIIAIFQPHLYSRTQAFYREFAQALQLADVIVLLNIYPAREKPIEGVSIKLIYDALLVAGHPNVHLIEEQSTVPELIKSLYQKGDMIITLGAGDVFKLHQSLKNLINEKK